MFSLGAVAQTVTIISLDQINNSNHPTHYVITKDIDASSFTSIASFGNGDTLEAAINPLTNMPYRIIGLKAPLFETVTGTVRNLVLENVNITSGDNDGNTGAIACVANGDARIYNVGILNGSVGGAGNTGGLVGLLDGTARVINCYSYADITQGGTLADTYCAGLVGNNNQTSSQTSLKTIVVNCMFYGDISTTGCSNYAPVYGNNAIENNSSSGINPYCYFSAKKGVFADTNFDNYKRSWPADEEYLTRFEYYRSILNSNRQLVAWWATGDVAKTSLVQKWVLDPSVAEYPILKEWGIYPSIINPDDTRTWDPHANNGAGGWQTRSTANPYCGKSFAKLNITVNPGSHAPSGVTSKSIQLTITDMDTANYDYGYYKVQLPYYNTLFGNPSSTDHDTRYAGNYTDSVVTGWKVTSVTGGTPGTFVGDINKTQAGYSYLARAWESGFNFADRNCTSKDMYHISGRVFAQGGFYYVPEGVTDIVIEAYWGKAVYLCNTGYYIDRVNITNKSGNRTVGDPFAPTGIGTLANSYQGQSVWDAWHTAVTKLAAATKTGDVLSLSVYDQAIVLLSNYQLKNENGEVGYKIDNKWHPYTIMSIDQDFDNEPDYCFEFQFRKSWNRYGIQPIRFDFLPVPELGLAVRHDNRQHTIGIFVPLGHFEITETSYMHTTQFEYDAANSGNASANVGTKAAGPVILNGGHFEQIVVRYGPQNKTQYFIMGGHFRMLRFTPGSHTNRKNSAKIRLCAVNAIGGDYPEFYLSGIYRPDIIPESVNKQGNPHCYTNGGKFGIMAGAGYDKILGSVNFEIDHSIIGEFYGGGINGANPIGDSIAVTINHSLVLDKYCGGPKVGPMTSGKTVTTYATGTTFHRYYGGGNGGTSYYREQGYDGNDYDPPADSAGWAGVGTAAAQNQAKFKEFNPLNTRTGANLSAAYDNAKGYHALYEFECFVSSNGLDEHPTLRTYTHWAQFGKTSTGNVTNVLDDCIIETDFYGGGNLGNVDGSVTSSLKDCTIKGNAFGGGFSGKIEPFRIHDKSTVKFPYIDGAGIMQEGLNGTNSCRYIKDGSEDRYYTWCYQNTSGQIFPQGVTFPATAPTTNKPTFQNEADGKWYVLTTESLEGLGAVSGNATLTLKGNTTVGVNTDPNSGNVFGGGNESDVNGNTTVILEEGANVLGNVYGGGNEAIVGGNSEVKIQNQSSSK